MTVNEAKAIVLAKHPDAIVGRVRGTGWIAAKAYPFGYSIGPNSNTVGEAWKRCAAHIQELAERNEAKA